MGRGGRQPCSRRRALAAYGTDSGRGSPSGRRAAGRRCHPGCSLGRRDGDKGGGRHRRRAVPSAPDRERPRRPGGSAAGRDRPGLCGGRHRGLPPPPGAARRRRLEPCRSVGRPVDAPAGRRRLVPRSLGGRRSSRPRRVRSGGRRRLSGPGGAVREVPDLVLELGRSVIAVHPVRRGRGLVVR